jgi:hypothetical protein
MFFILVALLSTSARVKAGDGKATPSSLANKLEAVPDYGI